MGEAGKRRVDELFTIEAAATGIREATLQVCEVTRVRSLKGSKTAGKKAVARKEAGLDILSPLQGKS
jgi:hypothetical protein